MFWSIYNLNSVDFDALFQHMEKGRKIQALLRYFCHQKQGKTSQNQAKPSYSDLFTA